MTTFVERPAVTNRSSVANAALLPNGFFDSVASVYGDDPTTGRRTLLLRRRLACHVEHLSTANAASGPERDEFLRRRRLFWDYAYFMPDYCEIVIGNERWTPLQQTFGAFEDGYGRPQYRRCDIVFDRFEEAP